MEQHTDWGIIKLKGVLFWVLNKYDQPAFFFIEGLDEVTGTDKVAGLLSLIRSLLSFSKTKLCAASRKEPMLK